MKTRLDELWFAVCSLLIFIVLLNDVRFSICLQQSGEVYIYGFPESPNLQILLRYFDNKSDWEVIFFNLENSSFSQRFLKIVNAFGVLDIQVLPPWLCISCELAHFTWDDLWMMYASPIVGFFRNGRLIAITVGITNYEILDEALMVNDEDVKVFTSYDAYTLSDEGVKARLEELLIGQEESRRTGVNVLDLTSSIVFLALADSVNPCTFAVFTALLFITLYSFGKMKAAMTGFSFILAIFIGYYALGLGLFQILATIPNINKALAVVGLVMGVFSVTSGLKPKFKSPIPKSIRRFMELRINKSYASPMASFVLGLFAAFTLLPCSSGPYLVALGAVSALTESFQAYLLLTLYNILFVAPLIVILVAILASSKLSYRIKVFRSTRLGVMELISGVILVTVCFYLLLF